MLFVKITGRASSMIKAIAILSDTLYSARLFTLDFGQRITAEGDGWIKR